MAQSGSSSLIQSPFYDLVEDCSKFTFDKNRIDNKYWAFCHEFLGVWQQMGYVHPTVVSFLQKYVSEKLIFDAKWTRLALKDRRTPGTVEDGLEEIRHILHIAPTSPWRGLLNKYGTEKWRLIGILPEVGFLCDIAPLFGIITSGVHLNIYMGEGPTMQIGVATRSMTKTSFPGLLDQCVAGGYQAGVDRCALDCLQREASEELRRGLPRGYESKVERKPTIQYMTTRDERWDSSSRIEDGVPECGIRVPFDLRVDDLFFLGNEAEVATIEFLPARVVKERLLQGLFKPNSALIMVDFLIRHGLLEDDPGTEKIKDLLRKRLYLGHMPVDDLPWP
ncbi:Thiamine pyrophosphokinase [Colletotrichum trifolii]|uniref:Thiamine pyrophosphokinase n=1 Tax=Colletotrichum trifolii TaxID=5466 RepID=A0A4R8RMY6_COLTR|nr:Thiamine pyrophosphokinase [Colletotrichum trifolii]